MLAITALHETQIMASCIVDIFLQSRQGSTLRAYQADMRDFATFMGINSNGAAQLLLCHGAGQANRLVLEYRTSLEGKGLSSATINRRLATLRSLVKLSWMLGLVTWELEIESLKNESYRDTRGPQESGFRAMEGAVSERTGAKGARDRAILYLLHDLALRRGEICSLNLQDFDPFNRTLFVLGKGKKQKSKMSLPERTYEALMAWVNARGSEPGPLFTTAHRGMAGARLTTSGLYRIVQAMGEDADLSSPVTPHQIRHTAITTAVERAAENEVDLDKVRQFSRHANIKTLQIYVDRHEDFQGKISEMVAR